MGETRDGGAARQSPPVRRVEWVTGSALGLDQLEAEARQRAGLDTEAWLRTLQHGGVHVGGDRFSVDRTTGVPAGARIRVYTFTREPETVALRTENVLRDAGGIVAINKPAGMPTQPTMASDRLALESRARELLGCEWLYALNRLDTGTSGVVLLARTREAAAGVRAQFDARAVRKRYLAWVAPAPKASAWRVSGWIVQVPHPDHAHYALRSAPCDDGRDSLTDFYLVEKSGGEALVSCMPRTGRSHQLRVHLSAGHTPVVGDRAYGSRVAASRPLLHSAEVTLVWPGESAPRIVLAPVPADFAR